MAAGRARGARAVPGGSLGEAGAVGRGPRAGSGASPSGYPESEHMDGVLISGTAAYELLGRVNRATQYWVSGLTFVVLFWLWSDAAAWAVGGSVVAAVLNKGGTPHAPPAPAPAPALAPADLPTGTRPRPPAPTVPYGTRPRHRPWRP